MKIPHISNELMDYLETNYPEKCPEPKQEDRDIWIMVGSRKLVRHLRRLHETQVQRGLLQGTK